MGRKRKRTSGSKSGWFRGVFEEVPQWLDQKSNDDVLARYRVEHSMGPGEDVGKSVKQAMSNVKSNMRKELRDGVTRKGGKTKLHGTMPKALPSFTTGKPTFEKLEELIDESLITAKGLDREGLEDVIKKLRDARNAVVWKMGQKD